MRRPGPEVLPRLFLAALLSSLGACQSLAPPTPEAASERIRRGLTTLDAAQSSQAARDKAEAAYRRSLERILPRVVAGEAEPEFVLASGEPPDWHAPETLAQIDPVRRRPLPDTALHRQGVGVPAVGRITPGGNNAPVGGFHVPITALAIPRLETGQLQVALANPERVASINLGSRRLPVAMDLEAPLDATRSLGPGPFAGLRYLLRADRFAGQSRIVFLQPFDAEKRPLVLVHGLMTTPQMWTPLVRALLADPLVRDHYQIWFFYYPTAQPVPLSALQLREALDDAATRNELKQSMVLVGYSMGGVLSRAQISGLDGATAEEIVPRLSELPVQSPVRRALEFKPRNDVSRAVFMFTPHRGSHLATFNLALWVSRLIRLPHWVRSELTSVADALVRLPDGSLPTSIHGLSPDSQFLRALDRVEPTVPTHSVIGNRGRRGDLARSSDGVVPYASAHLPSAESELIVPTGHGGFAHPIAVAELKRILRLNLALSSPPIGQDR
jgi:hypothetical protein